MWGDYLYVSNQYNGQTEFLTLLRHSSLTEPSLRDHLGQRRWRSLLREAQDVSHDIGHFVNQTARCLLWAEAAHRLVDHHHEPSKMLNAFGEHSWVVE